MAKISSKNGPTVKQQLTDLNHQLKRAMADYQNLQKRVDANQKDYIKFATSTLLDKFLPVLDDLERAHSHLKDKGLKLILDQFKQVLTSEGVKEMKVKSATFNPQTMDCTELTVGSKNKVISVIQKGYTLNDKVLRPAKVKVGKGG